ncbi:MAG TPA: hypothetical protein VHA70_04820 [Bauldia sp.]|nr:hypothetical protein [Bauldia sp.]
MASNVKPGSEARVTRALQRSQDAASANRELAAENQRIADNTARLRGLRLAKEAADAKALAEAPKKKAKKPARNAKSIPVDKLNASNDD